MLQTTQSEQIEQIEQADPAKAPTDADATDATDATRQSSASPATPPAGSRRSAPALDGVRALAVVAVVVFHAAPSLLPGGYLGVDVFFVLSGFLITTLLLNEGEASGSVDLPRFWLRRARRLVPGLVLMVAVVAALTLLVRRDTGVGLRAQVFGALTWSSNWVQGLGGHSYINASEPQVFNHLWSLAVEEQFYLVWPVLLIGLLTVCRARRRRAVRLVALLAVVSAAAMALTWSLEPDPTGAYMFTYSHAFGLLLGAALALSQQPNLLRTWRPHFRPISPVGLSVAAAAALGFLAVAAAGMEWSSRAPYVGGLFLVSAASVVVVLASSNETPFARTLDARWLRWVGRRSYGIYLWHWPLIVLALRLAPPDRSAPAAWTAVGLSVVAAALSYRFVETPIRRNGFRASLARWFGSGVGRPAPAAYRRPVLLIVAASLVVMAAGAVLTAPRTGRLASTLAQGQAAVARSQQPVGPAGGGPALGRPAGSDVLHGSATRTPSWMSPGHPSLAGTARGLVPCREVRNGSAVSAFGDSVLVASSPELLDSMPKMRITAEVGWQYDRVARAVNTALARGTLRPVVVIASGTNGPLEVGAVRHLLHELQPGRRVVLVTPYVPRSWGPTSVRTVDAVAARSPRVAVADWHSAIAARPDLLDPDHVHPGPAAGRIYTDTLQRALAATCSG